MVLCFSSRVLLLSLLVYCFVCVCFPVDLSVLLCPPLLLGPSVDLWSEAVLFPAHIKMSRDSRFPTIISNNDQQNLRSACAYAQSDQSFCKC